MMMFHIFTLFPKMFSEIFSDGIIGRALNENLIKINIHNIRDFSNDKHFSVDDLPYGGGPGMLMKPEPIFNAVNQIKDQYKIQNNSPVILTTPQGDKLTHNIAHNFSEFTEIIIICGRYEGFDERIRKHLATHEISLGDFVLSGGEIPAMAIVDSISRLLPNVLGSDESAKNDSFYKNFLQFPQYTRPSNFEGMLVPEVLLSGNHKDIEKWRKIESIKKTINKRPDLLDLQQFTQEEKEIYYRILDENSKEKE
ncbi:MAG: tRNA (guanosine(37)-N1)-methyltransferase TrmD [Dehalococcoidia bacterium]